jgi:hypothetical protein
MHSFRDNGTDGWGLARAYWGLSYCIRYSRLVEVVLDPHTQAGLGHTRTGWGTRERHTGVLFFSTLLYIVAIDSDALRI